MQTIVINEEGFEWLLIHSILQHVIIILLFMNVANLNYWNEDDLLIADSVCHCDEVVTGIKKVLEFFILLN